MFHIFKKDVKLINIVLKVFIITYLLFICVYHINLPTYAYFYQEQTVETTFAAEITVEEKSDSEDINDNDEAATDEMAETEEEAVDNEKKEELAAEEETSENAVNEMQEEELDEDGEIEEKDVNGINEEVIDDDPSN
ncbi:hypothetical protein WKU33_09570 [Oceanobacillus sp. HCA-5259]|uniref:hypothetical protein n=1 Tax=Oceanobacillus sp. HCA-5259 TaxID=3134661 RepID=UPI0030C515C9